MVAALNPRLVGRCGLALLVTGGVLLGASVRSGADLSCGSSALTPGGRIAIARRPSYGSNVGVRTVSMLGSSRGACALLVLIAASGQSKAQSHYTGSGNANGTSEPSGTRPVYDGPPVGDLDPPSREISIIIPRLVNGYATVREKVISSGWVPVDTKQCRTALVAAPKNESCEGELDTQTASCICHARPETGDCSGDGYCNMNFHKSGSSYVLVVSVYDDAMVTGWTFAKSPR